MKQITQKLEAEMAKAVSLIISASEEATIEAVTEAFGLAHQQRRRGAVAREQRTGMQRTSMSPNRTNAEIRELEEGFFAAVMESPGESMNVLASHIGTKASQLRVAVVKLKRNGRIKTVGERQFTRYFPITRNSDNDTAVDE
jgi:hypothetical protein